MSYGSRSPFYQCSKDVTATSWNCTQTHTPGGICVINGNRDTPILCQQLRISGQLLIAACVLLGVAFFTSVALALFAFGRGALARLAAPLALLLCLLTLSGAVCMAVAQFTGALALLVLQFPNGESATSTGDQSDILDTWTGSSGMSFAAASWTMAAFAAFFAVAGVALPKGLFRSKRNDRVAEEAAASKSEA
jgi:hypothetical protein